MTRVPAHVQVRAFSRHLRLLTLGFESYHAYIGSTVWARVRSRYASDPSLPQECICGETDVQLHHLTYERVGGDEPPSDLLPLCRGCHCVVHVLERRGDCTLDPRAIFDRGRADRHKQAGRHEDDLRAIMRAVFHVFPATERLIRLREACEEHGTINLRRDVRREIWRGLWIIEQQVASNSRGIEKNLRRAESRITSARPDALLDLVL